MTGHVVAVCSSGEHRFSKKPTDRITIVAGIGVDGDAHAGERVQHLSRVHVNPDQPNLRQVHLIHSELFDGLASAGFDIAPGDLGENITTHGIDLLSLSRYALLHIGEDVVLKVTGLRNPCSQIEAFRPGLLKMVAVKTPEGIVRKAGIMTVALHGGDIRRGDAIAVETPKGPHIPLERV
ncbi:MOSC domain-containing protein [Erythrobacter sp. THAF29]|uniref:MOSC domain-containing protein n=1 Tax=Erythrobacter sp. THAF29 TaxID=2587851 RepID=UPI0012697D4C|nr:MOSC domain-containing protein [Erythrobacter sp. THAF29]QFT77452.1 MOSC domain protein [Erythrobacter sp. THAF29]